MRCCAEIAKNNRDPYRLSLSLYCSTAHSFVRVHVNDDERGAESGFSRQNAGHALLAAPAAEKSVCVSAGECRLLFFLLAW